ncbi:MAG: ABC-2 family transporter protein, partial [Anaeroplasmataceae bacterium]|nr:ABC-2 family transporter protein [Anaeroplasmataceae bacterium]
YTFKEMICYLVMINIFTFVVFSNNTMWQIKEEIKDGTIAMAFVKPISYRMRFIFTNLGNVFMQTLLIGLPCFSIAYIIFICIGYIQIASFWIFLLHLILFILALFFATMLNDVIDYIFGIFCFYTSSGWGISQIKTVIIGFFAGTLLPLSFFPGIFGEIIQYLPFAGIAQNPVLILLMKVDPIESLRLIGLSFLWLIVLEGLAALLFRHASKKVTVQGG